MNPPIDTKESLVPKNTPDLESIGSRIIIGNRIPKDYFITKGKGESDITIHAGSYHLALKDAGIHMYNIIVYSSILPGIARQIKRPKDSVHGSVMETLMAVADSKKGTRATAGIIMGWLYQKQTNERYGGFVCEYNGSLTEQEAESQLRSSLDELYTNGYSKDYDLRDTSIIIESFIPKKRYGTAVVSLCFTNYIYPVLKNER